MNFAQSLRGLSTLVALFVSLASAPLTWAVPLPIHSYDFNGDLLDHASAGVAITSEGGVISESTYQFNPKTPADGGDANQGLTLGEPAISDPGVYSIEMYLTYDTVRSISDDHWIKLIDFKDASEALGVYYEDMPFSTRFEPVPAEPGISSLIKMAYTNPNPGPPGVAQSDGPLMIGGEWNHVVTTRNSAGLFTCYVDGLEVFSFVDAASDAVFTGPNGVMRFLQNDTIDDSFGYYNVAPGAIDFLNIYNSALSSSDVQSLAAAVPEPSTLVLVTIAALLLPASRRLARRR